jgi:DNA-binding Xre family transcriptional regulator
MTFSESRMCMPHSHNHKGYVCHTAIIIHNDWKVSAGSPHFSRMLHYWKITILKQDLENANLIGKTGLVEQLTHKTWCNMLKHVLEFTGIMSVCLALSCSSDQIIESSREQENTAAFQKKEVIFNCFAIFFMSLYNTLYGEISHSPSHS